MIGTDQGLGSSKGKKSGMVDSYPVSERRDPMRAKFTLTAIALVVAVASVAAIHAGPPTDEPVVKSSVAPDNPKWSHPHNYGKIGMLHPTRAGVYFRLAGGQTAMVPSSGFYFLDQGDPNYQAMYDLLYRAAKERWQVSARTEPKLQGKDTAVVSYLIVTFPAED